VESPFIDGWLWGSPISEDETRTGWWFGTWLDYDFPFILGISSSQLTKPYFSEGFKPPTRMVYNGKSIYRWVRDSKGNPYFRKSPPFLQAPVLINHCKCHMNIIGILRKWLVVYQQLEDLGDLKMLDLGLNRPLSSKQSQPFSMAVNKTFCTWYGIWTGLIWYLLRGRISPTKGYGWVFTRSWIHFARLSQNADLSRWKFALGGVFLRSHWVIVKWQPQIDRTQP